MNFINCKKEQKKKGKEKRIKYHKQHSNQQQNALLIMVQNRNETA
jgi:hypothetical protein